MSTSPLVGESSHHLAKPTSQTEKQADSFSRHRSALSLCFSGADNARNDR